MDSLLLVLALILANGLFSMSELAIVSSRKSRLEAAAARGDRGARTALALSTEPSRFLSTVQVGITLIAILSGAIGESAIADDLTRWISQSATFGGYARLISTAIVVISIAYLSVVIGELVPKRIAMAYPEPIARVMAPGVALLAVIGRPVVWILTASTDVLLALFGISKAAPEVTQEDIKGLIVQATETGAVIEQEKTMVEGVFRLADRKVRALMVPRNDIEWLDIDDSPKRIRVAVATSFHSHFPVCKGGLDDIIGIVHVKDLVKAGLLTDRVNIAEIAEPPFFVPDSMTGLALLQRFQETGRHLALVVDEYGGLQGLVTLNDIVGRIIGEMSPPGDEEPMWMQRPDGSWLLDGALDIDEVHRILGLPGGLVPAAADAEALGDGSRMPSQLPVGEFHTLAGMITAYLGHIPQTGETLTLSAFKFEVVDMDRQRVDKLLVTRVAGPGAVAADVVTTESTEDTEKSPKS